jgi:hypothetical protein
MAGVALLLQHEFRKVYFAGSTTSNYNNLRPQGTHPLLDPLWSTETTAFFHDGCEVRRVEKAAQIAESHVAMRHLQVCGKRTTYGTYGTHNCGRCEKCVRTMLNLVAADALERCEALPDWVDSEAVRSLDLSSYGKAYLANENLRALKRLGTQPKLVAALEEALERGAVRIAHSGYKEENFSKREQELEEARSRISKLRKQNHALKDKLSARRYRFVDTALKLLVQVPGAEKILRNLGR